MTLSEILVGLLVLLLAAGLFAAIARPGAVGSRFSSTVAAPTTRATSTKPAAG